MAKNPVSKAGQTRHEKTKQAVADALSRLEEFPRFRQHWIDVLPADTPYVPERRDTSYARGWLYRNFTAAELDEIEKKAIDKRIANYGSKIVHVLDTLYDLAIESGDVSAAKEFLNRTLGQSKQKVTMEYETGDNLTSLLQDIRASDAYARPRLDNYGREIIELSADDVKQIEHSQEEDNENDEQEPEPDSDESTDE